MEVEATAAEIPFIAADTAVNELRERDQQFDWAPLVEETRSVNMQRAAKFLDAPRRASFGSYLDEVSWQAPGWFRFLPLMVLLIPAGVCVANVGVMSESESLRTAGILTMGSPFVLAACATAVLGVMWLRSGMLNSLDITAPRAVRYTIFAASSDRDGSILTATVLRYVPVLSGGFPGETEERRITIELGTDTAVAAERFADLKSRVEELNNAAIDSHGVALEAAGLARHQIDDTAQDLLENEHARRGTELIATQLNGNWTSR